MKSIVIVGLLAALGCAGWAGPFIGAWVEPAGPSLLAGWDVGPVVLWAAKPISQLATWVGDYEAGLSLVTGDAVAFGFGGEVAFAVSPPLVSFQYAGPYLALYVSPIAALCSYLQAGLYCDPTGAWTWGLRLGAWLDFAGLIPAGGE